MSSSLSNQQLKEYIEKHKIEENINKMVNYILREQPHDPYAVLAQQVQKQSSPEVQIKKLKAYEILNSDGQLTIQIEYLVEFLARNILVSTNIGFVKQSDNQTNILYDEEQSRFQGKGMVKACEIINTDIIGLIKDKNLSKQSDIDEILHQYLEENNHINLIQPISFSIPKIQSICKNEELYQTLRQNYDITSEQQIPQLQIPILITNGKCKVQRFYIIFHNNSNEILKDFTNLTQAVKKTICSGKGGEASLKISQDGSFICTHDTIMDNIKIIEDAIISSNLKDHCKIGLAFNGDSMWQQDKAKYELEGPKQLFDVDQMIDYYIKLCADKPLIAYLEDPLLSTDQQGYQKLIEKLQQIKICSRKIADFDNEIAIHQAIYRQQDFKLFSNFYEKWLSLSQKEQSVQMIIEGNVFECLDFSYIDMAFAFNCILCLTPPNKCERIKALNHFINISDQIQQK